MLKKIIVVIFPILLIGNEGSSSVLDLDSWNYNAGITLGFGDSYDDYTYMENKIDLNFFRQNFSGWLQLEYSDPPELGLPIKDLRKYRFEYSKGPWSLQYGDIYELWGRGLILAQLDDQGIDFDNSTRGYLFNYSDGPLKITHMNGETKNAQLGLNLRTPEYEFTHVMDATNIDFNINNINLGLSFLQSNEAHEHKPFGMMDTVNINHRLHGGYFSWFGSFADIFFEYVDKQSKLKTYEENFGDIIESLDPLKKGSGIYFNTNLYLGGWSVLFEYKRYSFDRLNPVETDYIINHYGNRIDYQLMPTLYKEQIHSFLGRVAHQINNNDERGIQVSFSGSLPKGFQVLSQYSHLSRNDDWISISPIQWERNRLKGGFPSSSINSLPYKEFYTEIDGSLINDKLYIKAAYANNQEILKVNRFFDGQSKVINDIWAYTDSIDIDLGDGYDWYFTDSAIVRSDTSIYNIETKLYQSAKSFTIPIDFTYAFNNDYSIGISYAYQERRKENVKKGNAGGFYNYSDSTWIFNDDNDPNAPYTSVSTSNYPNETPFQLNRMISLSIGKASKWAVTLNYDKTNVQDVPETDPKYNPLEALIYGDIDFFTGKRNKNDPPAFTTNKWVSLEISFNLSSTQRISVLYGSMQGGLVCSNGVCRVLQPFNDGLKITYSAIL